MWKTNSLKVLSALIIFSAALFMNAAHADSRAIISGQVLNVNGEPIEGVSVKTRGARSVVTDAGGMYTIKRVKQKSVVLVNFSKEGYAPTLSKISLIQLTQVRDDEGDDDDDGDEGDDDDDEGDRDDDDEDEDDDDEREYKKVKLKKATVNKVLLSSGAVQTLDSAAGGTYQQDGFSVTFPSDSLTANGDVDLVIAPIDTSARGIDSIPGDFSARTKNRRTVTLELFSMSDFTLRKNGRSVNLKRGANAVIELLLPVTTKLTLGGVTPLWYFNTRQGAWLEESSGTVVESSTTPGRLAVSGVVTHFSYWVAADAMESVALIGRVVDRTGVALPYANVTIRGIDYIGSAGTTANQFGEYCILIKTGSNSEVIASLSYADIIIYSNPLLLSGAATPSDCNDPGVQVLPDFVIPKALTCVSGDIKDDNNIPAVGVIVFSNHGSSGITDANGQFQLRAAELAEIKVYTTGYPSVTVTTAAAGSPCTNVEMRPSPVLGCVMGIARGCYGPSIEGNRIAATTPGTEEILGLSSILLPDDEYCIDSLPTNTDINLRYFYPPLLREWLKSGTTDPTPGTCAAKSCKVINFDCVT